VGTSVVYDAINITAFVWNWAEVFEIFVLLIFLHI